MQDKGFPILRITNEPRQSWRLHLQHPNCRVSTTCGSAFWTVRLAGELLGVLLQTDPLVERVARPMLEIAIARHCQPENTR